MFLNPTPIVFLVQLQVFCPHVGTAVLKRVNPLFRDFSRVGLALGVVMFDGFSTIIACFPTQLLPNQSWCAKNTALVASAGGRENGRHLLLFFIPLGFQRGIEVENAHDYRAHEAIRASGLGYVSELQ